MTPQQRIEAFERLVAQRPDDAFARYSLAMSHRAAGDAATAVRVFEELRARHPEYVPTYLMLGQALESLGRGAEAARAYERGVEVAGAAGQQHARDELRGALEALRARGES